MDILEIKNVAYSYANSKENITEGLKRIELFVILWANTEGFIWKKY